MKRKHLYTILLAITILLFIPEHSVFAAVCPEPATVAEGETFFWIAIDILLRVFSWAWMIIATLAWQLMSNEWVYGSKIGIDNSLWNLWNHIKTLSNFAIGGFFLYHVFKGIIWKDTFNLKQMLPKFLITSILVNMSWFLMGALVDLSNLATAAVGDIPRVFFKDDIQIDSEAKKLFASIPEKVEVDLSCKNPILQNWAKDPNTKKYELDEVRAKYNDMSGPLLYMWLSIFRFQDYNFANDDVKSFKDLSIGAGLKLIVLIMFLAPIIWLLVVNLKRVWYLWFIVVFLPVAILFDKKIGLSSTPKMDWKIGWQSLETLISFKEIIWMVFTPVFTIAAMSLAMILTTSMYYVLGWTPWYKNATGTTSISLWWGTTIAKKAENTTALVTPWSDITIQGDIFWEVTSYAWWLVGYLIMIWFTIAVLWWVLGASVSGSKLAKATYDGIMDLWLSAAKWFKFIPLPGGAGNASIGSLLNSKDQLIKDLTWQTNASIQNQSTRMTQKFFTDNALGKGIAQGLGIKATQQRDIQQYELWELNKIKNSNNKTQNFDDFMWEVWKTLQRTAIGDLTLTAWGSGTFTNFMTEYAKSSVGANAIKNYALSNHKYRELNSFDPNNTEHTNNLFNTNTQIGKEFVAAISETLTGNKNVKINDMNATTLLFENKPEEAASWAEATSPTPPATPSN